LARDSKGGREGSQREGHWWAASVTRPEKRGAAGGQRRRDQAGDASRVVDLKEAQAAGHARHGVAARGGHLLALEGARAGRAALDAQRPEDARLARGQAGEARGRDTRAVGGAERGGAPLAAHARDRGEHAAEGGGGAFAGGGGQVVVAVAALLGTLGGHPVPPSAPGDRPLLAVVVVPAILDPLGAARVEGLLGHAQQAAAEPEAVLARRLTLAL